MVKRADNRVEYINLLGIDVYDENGARIVTGMTPSISPAVFNNDTLQFGPQFLIDGIHSETDAYGFYRIPHSTADANAYQQVDLGRDKVISRIVIYNRKDNNDFGDRIKGCELIVTNAEGAIVVKLPFLERARAYTYTKDFTQGSGDPNWVSMYGGLATSPNALM